MDLHNAYGRTYVCGHILKNFISGYEVFYLTHMYNSKQQRDKQDKHEQQQQHTNNHSLSCRSAAFDRSIDQSHRTVFFWSIRSHWCVTCLTCVTCVTCLTCLTSVTSVTVLPVLLSLLYFFDPLFDRSFDRSLSLKSICLSIYLSSVFLLYFLACYFSKATICQDNLRKKTVIIVHSPRIIIK